MDQHKACTKCKQVKPASGFFPRYDGSGKRAPQCKACHADDTARYKRENPAAKKRYAITSRRRRFRQKFGITIEDYERLLFLQGGVCDICHQPETSPGNAIYGNTGIRMLAIDHNHTTGVIRGLLCSNCNRAIGLLKDQPALLKRATEYLERHENQPDPNNLALAKGSTRQINATRKAKRPQPERRDNSRSQAE